MSILEHSLTFKPVIGATTEVTSRTHTATNTCYMVEGTKAVVIRDSLGNELATAINKAAAYEFVIDWHLGNVQKNKEVIYSNNSN